ncbi:MAG: diacylglycerol kinase family protein [Polyangiaceae bacterium]
MRPLVVVNPQAAGGRAGRIFPEVQRVLERRLGPVDVLATARPGHAIDLSLAAAREGRKLVIAVGGDGTLHEVANGVLAGPGDTAVGYVGQGTGGDFRRTMGLDHRIDRYVDAIARGRDRIVDVGKVTFRAPDGAARTRWFVNILSAGIGGLVDRYVGRTTKRWGGSFAYAWASTRALAQCERGELVCASSLTGVAHERQVAAYMIAICNGRYFGGGMHVAPMAEPDDGRFEVISMDAPSKLAFVAFSRLIYRGRHLAAPGVKHFGCDRIRIDLANDRARSVFLLDVDGEPLGGLPIEVDLVRNALRVRA